MLLAAVFQVAGWTGLALLRAALVGATFWLVMATLKAMGCAPRPAALLALGGFVVAAPALALRPQLFAIVLFAAALAILADRARHPRRLLLLPLVAIAWANLHGSFPLIVVVLGLGWADELGRVLVARAAIRPGHGPGRATDAIRGSTGIALLAAISALLTLVNPFGIDAWRYVAGLASDPSVTSAVSEWRPPSPLDPAGAIFYVSLLIGLVIAVLRVRADRNRIGPATFAPIATLLAFGVLGVLTGRGLAWWALVLPISASALAHDGSLTRFVPRRLGALRILFAGSSSPAAIARANRPSQLNTIVALLLILVGVGLLPAWRPIGPAGVPRRRAQLSRRRASRQSSTRTPVRGCPSASSASGCPRPGDRGSSSRRPTRSSRSIRGSSCIRPIFGYPSERSPMEGCIRRRRSTAITRTSWWCQRVRCSRAPAAGP